MPFLPCPRCGAQAVAFFPQRREYLCTDTRCGLSFEPGTHGFPAMAPSDVPASAPGAIARPLPARGGDTAAAPPIDLEPLPSFIAIPVAQWLAEHGARARLDAIAKTFEILTRYFFALVLADLVRRHRERLPREVTRRLGPSLVRPTFGQWIRLTKDALELHEKIGGHAGGLTEHVRHATEHAIWPLLGDDRDDARTHLIPLRNVLAHHGMTERAATRFLHEDGHERRAFEALGAQIGWPPPCR